MYKYSAVYIQSAGCVSVTCVKFYTAAYIPTTNVETK